MMVSTFSCTCWSFGGLLWKNAYSGLLLIFQFFFAIELYESFIRYVIFPHSVGCFFILLMVPFAGQTLFSSLMKNHVFIFASLVAQLVNNPPAMRDTWVRSLGWEDPLETVNATHPVFWPGESMDSPRGRQE